MTASVNVYGVHIPVTESIQECATENLRDIADRYDATRVSLTFKECNGMISVVVKYNDHLTTQTIKKEGTDLYSVIREASATLNRTVTKKHQKAKGRRQRPSFVERDNDSDLDIEQDIAA